MNQLQSQINNIPIPVVARVEAIKHDNTGFSHLLSTKKKECPFILLRSGSPNRGTFIHPSILVNQLISFHIGDILFIDIKGKLLRIYENESNDNALFLTNKCNSRCIICPQNNYHEADMEDRHQHDLIDLILQSPVSLGITGGEPTCKQYVLCAILEHIKIKHPNCFIQLLTNGRKLSDYYLAQ